MAFIGKVYKCVEADAKFPAYVKSLGLPAEAEEKYINSKPVCKIEKNGDSYSITVTVDDDVYPVTFKSGVEFEQSWGDLKSLSTYTVDGNTVNHVSVVNGKKTLTKSEYTASELKETYSGDGFDGVATRYFKAV